MAEFKVGYFVGSLATKSINRLLARALVRVAPQELQLTEIPFKDLPLYCHRSIYSVRERHDHRGRPRVRRTQPESFSRTTWRSSTVSSHGCTPRCRAVPSGRMYW